jgi:hypothetical protein
MDIFVINMIPKSLSAETNQDSEPNLGVDPAKPLDIAATAYTPDPLSGPLAPIYVSSDGGHSWALNLIVPGAGAAVGFYLPTNDISLHFSGTSNALYAGILRADLFGQMNILRTNNFLGAATMTVIESRGNEDQPWVESTTATSLPGTPDKLYVGNNNFGTSPKTATIDMSQNADIPVPVVAPQGIASRTPGSNNGPPTRPVAHSDGTVYAAYINMHQAFFGNGNYTCDVVVCRDDNWGQGGTPFTALIDGSDLKAGLRVAVSTTMPWQNGVNFLGQERGGFHVAIAVDPRDSSRVFLAWADYPGGNPPLTIHLERSLDRGVTWSSDLRTVDNGINPALAIDGHGRVGFLYQTLTHSGATWETILEISDDGFSGAWSTHVLSSTPSNTPAQTFYPYIGDYIRLQAVGTDFYGVFCANNTPDHANFPNGVIFQRNANFTTHTLLAVDNVTPVPISIDPFFFKVKVKPAKVATVIADRGFFGDACLGSFRDDMLTIDNSGSGTLKIFKITSNSLNFEVPSVLSYPLKVEAGDSIDLMIRFKPTGHGFKVGKIEIVSNDPASPHVVDVSGECPAPRLALVLANKGNFGRVCVGRFVDESLILTNSGKCTLTVHGITSSSGEFLVPEVLSYPIAIGPGDALPLPIRFEPTKLGSNSGTIAVTSDDPASPATINVSGNAPFGKLAVTGSTNFGGVTACCCADRTISICNVGDCDLHVTSVRFKRKSNHWRLIHNPFPAALHAGSCLSVVIQYRATERCPRSCELLIESDDPTAAVKTLDVLAYTIWDEGCCKEHCEDCGKGCCEKTHKESSCKQGYPCCDDDDDEENDEYGSREVR